MSIVFFLLASKLASVKSAVAGPGVMTDQMRAAVTNKHNEYRNAMSYPCTAADMEMLEYDLDLEKAAQEYVNQCNFAHESEANYDNDWGENIAVNIGSLGVDPFLDPERVAAQLQTFVQNWYDEKYDVAWNAGGQTKSVNRMPFEQGGLGGSCSEWKDKATGQCVIGHFTQVIWARSNKIGCAWSNCHSASPFNEKAFLVVCKYNPAGNIIDREPYVFGRIAAMCSEKAPEPFPNLCKPRTTVARCRDALYEVDYNGKVYGPNCTGMSKDNKEKWCSHYEKAFPAPGTCAVTCGQCERVSGIGIEFCQSPQNKPAERPTDAQVKSYEEYVARSTSTYSWWKELILKYIFGHYVESGCILLVVIAIVGIFAYCYCCPSVKKVSVDQINQRMSNEEISSFDPLDKNELENRAKKYEQIDNHHVFGSVQELEAHKKRDASPLAGLFSTIADVGKGVNCCSRKGGPARNYPTMGSSGHH